MNNNNDLFSMFDTNSKEEPVTNPQPQPVSQPQPVIPQPEVDNKPVPDEIINIVEEPKVEKEFKPIPDEIMNSISKNTGNNEDKELLRLYVGPNYETMVAGGFSFCTFFFGIYYLFYRKQNKYILPLFGLQIAMSIAYGLLALKVGFVLAVLNIAIYFIIAKNFKRNYIEEAKMKINEIKNQTMILEEQKELIKKAGGVNLKVIILVIIMPIITTLITLLSMFLFINKVSSDFELHFPEAFNQTSGPTTNTYKLGNYSYSDVVFNYRNNDNVCNYKFIANNEYTTKNIKESKNNIAKKYLKEKHSINNKLKKVTYNNNDYFYYYNEKEKTDYYVYITDKSLTELNIVYVKDTNKKCHEMTEYILNNSKKVK